MKSLPEKLAFVDVETTGGRAHTDRIIEIGIVRVEHNTITKTFSSLIDPQCSISQMITGITGITDDMVATAPSFRQVADEVEAMLADCVMVAHNVRFDYSFIKSEFERVNVKFSPKHFCTVKLAKKLYPAMPHHDLSSLISQFGFACAHRHRAYDDAEVLWQFYQMVQQQFPEETVLEAITTIAKQPSLPMHIAPEVVKNLPTGSGVYIFYGHEDIPLYVGKSINIKARVLSHFSADYASQTEMKIAQQTRRIETIPTCGELGALITESTMVKTLKPIFNRKLRHCRQFVCAKQEQNNEGYTTVSLQTYDAIAAQQLPHLFGLFKSKSQAKKHLLALAEKHGLCQKLLGIEKASGACFAYRLGKCGGACVGQEKPAVYNTRMLTAFTQSRIRPWPFSGPIVLLEHDVVAPRYDAFVVDQWCLLEQVSINEDISGTDQELLDCIARVIEHRPSEQDLYFDADCYQIIASFLRQPKNYGTIHEVAALTSAIQPQEQPAFLGVL